jgi:hypothetical protein
MAGITRIFSIGGGGGFMGGDGPNPILAQIWQGDGSRQWFEVRYFEGDFGPMGKVETMIPAAPDSEDNLLDACIMFFPDAFKECPSFPSVEKQLEGVDRVDFDFKEGVPDGWNKLREEAREPFKMLGVWTGGELEPVQGWEKLRELMNSAT